MQPWHSREELVQQAVLLDGQGMSRHALARVLGVSRNTVRRILRAQARAKSEPHSQLAPRPARAPRPSRLDAFRAKVEALLAAYPEITAQRVFEELRTAGYEGSYSRVKLLVRKLRPPPRPTPSLETPRHGPGEMAQSDWSPFTLDFLSGLRSVVQVFDYVLAYSTHKTFLCYERADLYALMDAHVAAFERLEGVAAVCKYDCQKAVVLGWEGKQPIYNPHFLAFATHYGFRPQACRPFHPNDKPAAERSFWELERSFLCGRRFHDLADMRAQLAEWQRTVCDLRPHKHLKTTPLQRLAEERPHLLPLPCHPYDTARVVYRLCSLDGYVAWAGNAYAVPYDYVTDILPLRITQHELFVYAPDLTLIASHQLAPRSAGLKLDPAGLHRRRPKTPAIDVDALGRAFEDMGEEAAAFFAGLLSAQGRFAGHHARQMLLLRERYSTADLVAALRHARAFGAYDHHAVGRILAARATPRHLAEYVADQTEKRLGLLGPDATTPRDLDEYDRLPVASPPPKEDPCPSETSHREPTGSSSASDNTSISSA